MKSMLTNCWTAERLPGEKACRSAGEIFIPETRGHSQGNLFKLTANEGIIPCGQISVICYQLIFGINQHNLLKIVLY